MMCRTTLLRQQAPFPNCAAMVSDSLKFKGRQISVGDIVFQSANDAGKVIACAMENDELFVVVELMDFLENVSLQSAKWQSTNVRAVWGVNSLQLAFAWYNDLDVAVVLRT